MKIYIIADMEGISGITNPNQVGVGLANYEEGRKFLTEDVNACISGCFEGGAEEVIVRDAHYMGQNFLWHELDERASYIMGNTGDNRMPGIDGSDGLILLGYHAMAGTSAAVLEHTMSSRSWQNFWLNGVLSGEVGMDTAYAAEFNVPVIMISGDDKACDEAKKLIPNVITAEVKKSYSLTGAKLLSKEKAHELIKQKSAEAVRAYKNFMPVKAKSPVSLRLELVERTNMPTPTNKPYMKIIDSRTYEVNGDNYIEAFNRL